MKTLRIRTEILFLATISAFVLIWNTWSGSLMSWDEGFYGAVSKEMFRTGDLVNLYWAGMPWSDKPPLYMWMTNLFFNLFGINEFSVRLFSALSGVATVIVTYFIALKIYTRKTALISSLVLLTSWHFIWSSRLGMLDISLTFFISLSLLFFLIGVENKKFLLFCPLAFAMAFLTKGMGAMISPAVIFLYALSSGKARKLLDPYLITGSILSLAILLWWHLSAFAEYGSDFVRGYFMQHLVTRTTTAMDGHTGNIFTYLRVIPNKGRPWSIAGLSLIPIFIFFILRKKEKEHLLPVIWAISVIFIFSVVRTKLHWYIIPVYPALALIAGRAAESITKKYAIPLVGFLSLCSLIYLTMDKDIFNADHSPGIKATALSVIGKTPVEKSVFLYKVSDPGLQFYLGWAGQNIRGERTLNTLTGTENTYIFLPKNELVRIKNSNYTIITEYPDHALIRT